VTKVRLKITTPCDADPVDLEITIVGDQAFIRDPRMTPPIRATERCGATLYRHDDNVSIIIDAEVIS
jgi:hypothetical protein